MLLPLALLAVDGFAIAFGRIVQYQSVVMLAMLGALWCCWRFHCGAAHPRRLLVAAAVLLAVGLLAHYDAALVAPALAWLVIAGGRRRGWGARSWMVELGLPTLVGAALLASFFLPYVLGPSFAATADYLAGRAGEGDAGGPPFNNLPIYLAILSFYNAPPLVPLLIGLVLGALALLLARRARSRGPASPAAVAIGIWFATAFGAQAFLIAEPRTHFYTAHVPAALLVGLASFPHPRRWRGFPLSRARERGPGGEGALTSRSSTPTDYGLRTTAGLLVPLVILLAGGWYAQLAYLRQLPEFQRVYPAARPDLLRAPFGDTLPEAGYFGFPHRDGWKAVAELYRRGELAGSYDTNQNRWLVGWYLGGLAPHCKGAPDLYLIAEHEPTVAYPPGYSLAAEVLVGPSRALAIYRPAPPPGGPRRYELAELAAAFDARPLPSLPVLPLLTAGAPACAL